MVWGAFALVPLGGLWPPCVVGASSAITNNMSIFKRYTEQQLAKAKERLAKQCPLTKAKGSINIHGDDPMDPKQWPEPRVKRSTEKRHYRLKNH